MASLRSMRVENYRSIRGPLTLEILPRKPLVLIGENNVGKSNIVRALDLVLGGPWPGNREPEEHEFFGRRADREISVELRFDRDDLCGDRFEYLRWTHDPSEDGQPTKLQGEFPDGTRARYVNNADRDSCYCVTSSAEGDLSYQLSYRSKYTLLSKIMHRFHRDLQGRDPVREALEALFEQTKAEFYNIPSFATFSESLRRQLGDFLGSMRHRLDVDFEAYNPVNFFHALRLQPTEDGATRAMEELGTGEQQVLAISLAYAYAQAFHAGMILVLEEPEAHLHPLAQQWLARRLTDLAEGGVQLIMTSHSPHFVDLLNLEGLVLVRKEDRGTYVQQKCREELVEYCVETGVPEDRITIDSVLPFYRSHATPDLMEGFFANAVVLVEGTTEKLALPVYLEQCGLEVTRAGVAILPVFGKGNLAKWRRLFTLYGIPTYVIFDNDGSEDDTGQRRRDALRAVGVPDDAWEGLIEAKDWIVRDRYCVFGTDFESTLRDHLPDYEVLERAARADHGIEAKPFIARHVAERVGVVEDAAGWIKMKELADAIDALAPASQGNGSEQPPADDEDDLRDLLGGAPDRQL